MNKLILTAVLAIAFGSSAYAQGNLKTTEETAAKPDCKIVEITRPKVTKSPITLRIGMPEKEIKGGMTAAIEACNKDVKDSGFLKARPYTDKGSEVLVNSTIGDVGSVKIALPITLTDSRVDQVVCAMNPAANEPKHAKYVAAWGNQLPSKIEMSSMDSYDKDAADRGCAAAREAMLKKQ